MVWLWVWTLQIDTALLVLNDMRHKVITLMRHGDPRSPLNGNGGGAGGLWKKKKKKKLKKGGVVHERGGGGVVA